MNAKNIEKTEKRGVRILTVVATENEKPTVFARAVEIDNLDDVVRDAASMLVPVPQQKILSKIVDRLLAGKPAWYLDEYCFEWYEV